MDTHTILDFEYSHLIIIKKTFYSLKNKASTGFLKIASTGQSILKLNDYYTHTARGLHAYSDSYRGLHTQGEIMSV